jgi:hypothetical protein
MKKYPKHIRAQLRELMGLAYEQELSFELKQLATKFDSWKSGQISSSELDYLIHRYHDDSARELYKYYNNVSPDLAVARAVVEGWLVRKAIPDGVWPHIEAMVQFYRNQQDEE